MRSRLAAAWRVFRQTVRSTVLGLPALLLSVAVFVGAFVAANVALNGPSVLLSDSYTYTGLVFIAVWVLTTLFVLVVGAHHAAGEVSR